MQDSSNSSASESSSIDFNATPEASPDLAETVVSMEENSLLEEGIQPTPSPQALALWTEQARQGDSAALQQILEANLVPYRAKVVELELRRSRLQVSISGTETPRQSILEPLLQKWIVQLAVLNVSSVELYGQRDGSDLPHWRSAFDVKDIDLDTLDTLDALPQQDEEAQSSVFIDPLQVDLAVAPECSGVEQPELASASSLEEQSTHLRPFADSVLTPAPDVADPNPSVAQESLDLDLLESRETQEPTPLSPPRAIASEAKVKVGKDFLARYAAGERDFAHIDLSETDLSGVNLTLANLHDAKLTWSNLRGANLYHVNLRLAKLRHADLSGATLRSSNLQGTDFLNANLTGADLSWSNLNGANLTGADLTDANLNNAILERVILPDGTLLD